MLRQVRRRLFRTIMRQHTDTIKHDINIDQLRRAYQDTRPSILSTPQLFISATYPQYPGGYLITTQVMTIPEQIQATKNVYGRQMAPPLGNTLFYSTLSHNTAALTPTPHRSTPTRVLPLHSIFDTHTKHKVIHTHFIHPPLKWRW